MDLSKFINNPQWAGKALREAYESGLMSKEELASDGEGNLTAPTEPLPKLDGGIAARFNPKVNDPILGEKYKDKLVDERARAAVDSAQAQGILTASSGYDEEKRVGWAIGMNPETGETVRVEAEPEPDDSLFPQAQSILQRLYPKKSMSAPVVADPTDTQVPDEEFFPDNSILSKLYPSAKMTASQKEKIVKDANLVNRLPLPEDVAATQELVAQAWEGSAADPRGASYGRSLEDREAEFSARHGEQIKLQDEINKLPVSVHAIVASMDKAGMPTRDQQKFLALALEQRRRDQALVDEYLKANVPNTIDPMVILNSGNFDKLASGEIDAGLLKWEPIHDELASDALKRVQAALSRLGNKDIGAIAVDETVSPFGEDIDGMIFTDEATKQKFKEFRDKTARLEKVGKIEEGAISDPDLIEGAQLLVMKRDRFRAIALQNLRNSLSPFADDSFLTDLYTKFMAPAIRGAGEFINSATFGVINPGEWGDETTRNRLDKAGGVAGDIVKSGVGGAASSAGILVPFGAVGKGLKAAEGLVRGGEAAGVARKITAGAIKLFEQPISFATVDMANQLVTNIKNGEDLGHMIAEVGKEGFINGIVFDVLTRGNAAMLKGMDPGRVKGAIEGVLQGAEFTALMAPEMFNDPAAAIGAIGFFGAMGAKTGGGALKNKAAQDFLVDPTRASRITGTHDKIGKVDIDPAVATSTMSGTLRERIARRLEVEKASKEDINRIAKEELDTIINTIKDPGKANHIDAMDARIILSEVIRAEAGFILMPDGRQVASMFKKGGELGTTAAREILGGIGYAITVPFRAAGAVTGKVGNKLKELNIDPIPMFDPNVLPENITKPAAKWLGEHFPKSVIDHFASSELRGGSEYAAALRENQASARVRAKATTASVTGAMRNLPQWQRDMIATNIDTFLTERDPATREMIGERRVTIGKEEFTTAELLKKLRNADPWDLGTGILQKIHGDSGGGFGEELGTLTALYLRRRMGAKSPMSPELTASVKKLEQTNQAVRDMMDPKKSLVDIHTSLFELNSQFQLSKVLSELAPAGKELTGKFGEEFAINYKPNGELMERPLVANSWRTGYKQLDILSNNKKLWYREDIARDITGIHQDIHPALKMWKEFMNLYRASKISYNPRSAIRDVIGNSTFVYLDLGSGGIGNVWDASGMTKFGKTPGGELPTALKLMKDYQIITRDLLSAPGEAGSINESVLDSSRRALRDNPTEWSVNKFDVLLKDSIGQEGIDRVSSVLKDKLPGRWKAAEKQYGDKAATAILRDFSLAEFMMEMGVMSSSFTDVEFGNLGGTSKLDLHPDRGVVGNITNLYEAAKSSPWDTTKRLAGVDLASKLRSLPDNLTKGGAFLTYLGKGHEVDITKAAKRIARRYPTYDNVHGVFKGLGNYTGSIGVNFFAETTRILANSVVDHPWRVGFMVALPRLLWELSISDLSEAEQEELMKNSGWFTYPIPGTDLYADLNDVLPGVDLINNFALRLPGMPREGMPSVGFGKPGLMSSGEEGIEPTGFMAHLSSLAKPWIDPFFDGLVKQLYMETEGLDSFGDEIPQEERGLVQSGLRALEPAVGAQIGKVKKENNPELPDPWPGVPLENADKVLNAFSRLGGVPLKKFGNVQLQKEYAKMEISQNEMWKDIKRTRYDLFKNYPEEEAAKKYDELLKKAAIKDGKFLKRREEILELIAAYENKHNGEISKDTRIKFQLLTKAMESWRKENAED